MADDRPTTADIAERQSDRRDDLDDDLQDRARSTTDKSAETDDAGTRQSGELEPLVAEARIEHYRGRWSELQPRFVDEPRDTVREADTLVAELMQDLASSFSDARSSLEDQWSRGDDVSTEELRVALQRYRSFFERLLAA
jgi:hypothetical protein